MSTQPEACRLADALDKSHTNWGLVHQAAAELRRLHDLLGKANALAKIRAERVKKMEAVNQELLVALKVAAVAIHEYRTQGAPYAYWDDVEKQAAEAIAKGEAK